MYSPRSLDFRKTRSSVPELFWTQQDFRFGLSEHFEVAQKNIHAYVFGEHGDTSFVPWSCADVSGASLDDYAEMMRHLGKEPKPLDKAGMEEYVHKSGGIVIAKKGATFYAVSVAVCKTLRYASFPPTIPSLPFSFRLCMASTASRMLLSAH